MAPHVRPADHAETFYPGTAKACEAWLRSHPAPDSAAPPAVGCIVPHAGWSYGGRLSLAGLTAVQRTVPDAELILIFGGHLIAREPPRLQIEGGYETPIGTVEIAAKLAQDIAMSRESEVEAADDYYEDNAIEVLLPMLRWLWPDVPVVGIGVPPTADAADIGREVVQMAWDRGLRRIAAVGSTDLTHYGPNYRFQPQGRGAAAHAWVKAENDQALLVPATALESKNLVWRAERAQSACCPGAAAACIAAAKQLGATHGEVLEHRSSWEENPSSDTPISFVSYATIALRPTAPARTSGSGGERT